MLNRFLNNPYFNLLIGLILLVSSGYETWDSIDSDIRLGAHHGVLIFSLVHILKTLPELCDGLDKIDSNRAHIRKR